MLWGIVMKDAMFQYILSQAAKNSLDEVSEEEVGELVSSTEDKLGVELTGYATIDKPYNQFYSEEVLHKDFPKEKIATAVLKRAQGIREKTAYICERKFTYGQLYDNTLKYAKILRDKYHVGSGDRIVMDVLSTPDAICAFLAANLVGAKVRPIDPIYSVDQIEHILTEYEPKMIICNALHYGNMKKAIGSREIPVSYTKLKGYLPFIPKAKKQVINTIERLNEFKMKKSGDASWSNYCDEIESVKDKSVTLDDFSAEFTPNEVATIFSTSGTTGEAKGVEVTNENFLSNVYKEYYSDFDLSPGDSLFNPMPTCSSFFWYVISLAAFLGLPTSLSPLFDAKQSPKQISEDKSTWVLLGPIIIEQLCNYIESVEKNDSVFFDFLCKIEDILFGKNKLSSVAEIKSKRHYVSGGDLLTLDLERRAKSHGLVINNNLGTSENTGPSTNPNGGRRNNIAYYEGCVGVSLPGNDMAIFSYDEENGIPDITAENYEQGMRYYEIGEICFNAKNANVFAGYYNNPRATSEVKLKHQDGSIWYHSGDLGYMDPAGHVFCCGRKSGLIVRDGHKVWAPKIEMVGKKIPGISDCVVIGVPDDKDKEVPVCFVVFDEDVNPQQKNSIINSFYSQVLVDLDSKHVPYYCKELDEIPRNLMTKAKIGELKRIYDEEMLPELSDGKKKAKIFLKNK